MKKLLSTLAATVLAFAAHAQNAATTMDAPATAPVAAAAPAAAPAHATANMASGKKHAAHKTTNSSHKMVSKRKVHKAAKMG